MDLHIKLCKRYGIPKKDLINTEENNKNIASSKDVLEYEYSRDF